MSRWQTLPATANNPTYYPQNSALPGVLNQGVVGPVASGGSGGGMSLTGTVGVNEVFQHGTRGQFIRSEIEGVQSGFIRCIYQAKYTANQTVTELCEKNAGCCTDGCCPKDQFWMAGVFVLLAFVLLVFVVGTILMICCYQRSKNRQRREEKEAYEYSGYGSQVGMYPGGYTSYVGSEAARY